MPRWLNGILTKKRPLCLHFLTWWTSYNDNNFCGLL